MDKPTHPGDSIVVDLSRFIISDEDTGLVGILACPFCVPPTGQANGLHPADLPAGYTEMDTAGMEMITPEAEGSMNPMGYQFQQVIEQPRMEAGVAWRIGLRCVHNHGWILTLADIDGQVMVLVAREPSLDDHGGQNDGVQPDPTPPTLLFRPKALV